MRFSLGQRILLIGALIVLTLVSIHIVTNHRLQALHDINQKLEQTQRVISLGQNHLSALKDMEIGKRGFLISGSDDFLEPYVSGSLHLRQNMEKLRRLTAGEPKKQLLLDEIENLSEQKLRIMQQAINLRRERGFDAARAFMLSSGAKDVMDAIRTSMSRLLEIERHELDRTEKQASLQDESLHMTIVTIDLILLGITAALLLLIWNTIVRPIHLLKQGADQLANGNYDIHLDVRGRHELAELAGSFNHMATVINERTQTLKTLIDAMVDSIVVANTQGIIEVFNPAAERLFGYTAREAKGNKVNMLMPSPHKQRHDSYIQRFLQSKKPKILGSTIELEAQRKDGTTVPVELAINAVEVKQTIKFIAAIRDVSDRKAAEHALEQQARELERANRMKSEFLATMSHELRTPLNAIIGFSEVLKDQLPGPLNDKQTDYVREIFSSGQHLLELINDILDLSKIEAGKMEWLPEPVDVRDLLEQSLAIVRETAAEHRISLSLDIAPDLGRCLLDVRKSKQMLYNLLSNAVKFSPDGGCVRVSASCVPRSALAGPPQPDKPKPIAPPASDADHFLEFSIEDQGIGIAAQDLHKLFEPFVQIDSSLARRYEGTGLGLALVKRLAEVSGGTVGVRSTPGKGSIFAIWLPWEAVRTAHQPTLKQASTGHVGSRVLIVEDDMSSARLLQEVVNQASMDACVVSRAEQALELLQREIPAAIILDIILPGMDGWQLLARLKKSEHTAHIPVVIVSIIADKRKGFGFGVSGVLQKPVLRRELLQALSDVGLHQGSVLIVDDDAHMVEILADMLESHGMSVLRALDGRQGIELARRERPDIVILDLMMPEISGFEVIDALKSSKITASIPIIVLTSKVLTDEDRCCLNGHIMQIVEKRSLDADALIKQLRAIISNGTGETL